jgi:hypothetical protein
VNPIDLARRLTREGLERWDDILVLIPESAPMLPAAPPLPPHVGALKRLPKNKVESDSSGLPSLIGEKGERHRFPYLFLAEEAEKGLVLGFDLMCATSGVEKALKEISPLIARIFLELGFIPSEIRVKSQRLHDALGGFTPELKIELKQVPLLRRLDAARASL